MIQSSFYVIAFDSTHYAIQTESRLKEQFEVETIPTPREISASCGLSIKFSLDEFNEVMDVLKENQETFHVFRIEKMGRNRHITQIQ